MDVRDVACAHLLAAEHGQTGRRYILGGEDLTFGQIVRQLAQVAHYRPRWTPRLSPRAMHLMALAAERRSQWTGREPYPSIAHTQLNRMYWYCRSDRARAELGFAPRPVLSSLADTYRWHALRKPLKLSRLARWWMRHAAAG